MLTTYRLIVSLLFIAAMAAPGLSSNVRVWLGIVLASGLVVVWHAGRAKPTSGINLKSWTVVVPVSLLLAGIVFVVVWRALDSAASSGL